VRHAGKKISTSPSSGFVCRAKRIKGAMNGGKVQGRGLSMRTPKTKTIKKCPMTVIEIFVDEEEGYRTFVDVAAQKKKNFCPRPRAREFCNLLVEKTSETQPPTPNTSTLALAERRRQSPAGSRNENQGKIWKKWTAKRKKYQIQ